PDDSVAARFAARARDFRQVEFELHTFTSEHAAREFIAAVEEGEIAPRLGDHQRLPSSMLPRQIAEDIAAARPGDLLGPIETRANSHQVYRLLRWHEPQLDERLREHIREELFHEALDPILQKEALVFLV
ncbi:MAG: hypothetical protein MUF51_02225, partial [Vicinamibacteria bacterium]|nr:hypothetical protein [Vicinamibacteria bacterium]